MRGKRGLDRPPEGEALRWLRQVYLGGATQGDLAARIGASQSYIANLESGRTVLSPEKAREVAQIVAVTPEDEAEITARLHTAIVGHHMPEARLALETLRLSCEPGKPEADLCERWSTEVQQQMEAQGMGPEELANILGDSPDYVELLLRGGLMPPRRDVVGIARALQAPVEDHLFFAGYLPDGLLDCPQELSWIVTVVTSGDEKTRSLVSSVLRQAVTILAGDAASMEPAEEDSEDDTGG